MTTDLLHAFVPERHIDEFLDLASALSNQADHNDISIRISRHHSEQHALADAGTCEQTDALTAPDTEQRVYGSDADINRFLNRASFERIYRLCRTKEPSSGD